MTASGGAATPLRLSMLSRMNPETLDHVALWVADRDRIADFLTGGAGMHVVERTDAFTLVGSDARRGKLTLFAEEGPRERGPLKHVALRVSDLETALADLPEDAAIERPRDGEAYFDVHEGLRLGLVEADTAVEYDLDHVALWSADPAGTAEEYVPLGFNAAEPGPSGADRVEVGGAYVEFHPGDATEPERPLLNHLAMRVESAAEHIDEAKEQGVEIDKVVDAANTYAVFVWGPERVKLEYVEHKPGFALT
jgi:catechol 2,3-dioxygenase-like lactoylglutathione lyase family enzyme